jgi:regulator of nonsense transcripts 3
MSTTDVPTPVPKKRSKRSEKRATQAKSNPHERLKTIVRRLPPNLPEEIFWQSVQRWVSDETVLWKAFFPGKLRKKYVHTMDKIQMA